MTEGRARIAEFGPQRFRRYPDYRDSDVEWLGEIPAHWERYRLRWTVNGCQNGVWGDEADGMNDTICVRVADFNRTQFLVNLHDPTLRSIDPRIADTRLLKKKDLLLEKSGGGEKQPVGAVVMYNHRLPAVCSNFVARMPVAEGHHPRYLTYLHAALYTARINTRSIKQSTGIQNLDGASYLSEYVGTPGDREQCEIAGFLDRETAKIDAFVAKKEQLIELLQEKRTALITRAVTRGLDPNVPMKDSGVEWLGEIPAHWNVKRVKWVARMESGHTPDKKIDAYWNNGDIPWVSLNDSGHLREVDYIGDTEYYTNELGLKHSSARLLPARSVIFSRDATIGLCAITERPMAVSQHFIAWICGKEAVPAYLLRVFDAMQGELERLTMGATLRTIGMPDVKTLATPVPPAIEQEIIVDHIRKECSRLDALVAKVHQAIDHLKEYRTALLFAAVTGKIDVRKEAA